jgi:multiple sugar transport system substrate-binding protein
MQSLRKNLAVFVACFLVLSIYPCFAAGPETSPASKKTSASDTLPSGPVEINLWTDTGVSADTWNAIINKFEQKYSNPGYKVKLYQFSGSDRAVIMSAAIKSNTLPALFSSAWFTSTDFVHEGYVADISDIAKTVKDKMNGSAYNATAINNKSYMIGMYQLYIGMMYNATLFKSAGLSGYVSGSENKIATWTLDDLKVILSKLADYFKGTERYPLGFYAASQQADVFNLNMLSMYGGNLWKNGKSTAGSDKNVVKALDTMLGWYKSGWTNSNVVTKDGTEVGPDFKNQLSGVCSGATTDITSIRSAMAKGTIKKFDVRLAAIPQLINGANDYTMTSYTYGLSVMNNGKPGEIAVAREFIKFLLNDKESLTALNTFSIPCFTSVSKNPEVLAAHPEYAEFAKMTDKLWDFTGNVPGYVTTRSYLFPQLQSAFSGEKTAQQALTDYSAKANAVIDEYAKNSLVLN